MEFGPGTHLERIASKKYTFGSKENALGPTKMCSVYKSTRYDISSDDVCTEEMFDMLSQKSQWVSIDPIISHSRSIVIIMCCI